MLKSGHHSVLEHSNLTFEVDGYNPGYAWSELGSRLHYHPFTRTDGGMFIISGNLRAWIDTIAYLGRRNTQLCDLFLTGLQRALPSLFLDGGSRTFIPGQIRALNDSERATLMEVIPDDDHEVYSFRIICDRGISHEIVRHRLLSFTQESQRYVNYGGKGLQLINEPDHKAVTMAYLDWASTTYDLLINTGIKPQIARDVLPNLVKTEVYTSGRLGAWKHFIHLREAKGAHPRIREVATEVREWFEEAGII